MQMWTATKVLKALRKAQAEINSPDHLDDPPMSPTERRYLRASARVPNARVTSVADAIALIDCAEVQAFEFMEEDWETLLGQLRGYLLKVQMAA